MLSLRGEICCVIGFELLVGQRGKLSIRLVGLVRFAGVHFKNREAQQRGAALGIDFDSSAKLFFGIGGLLGG